MLKLYRYPAMASLVLAIAFPASLLAQGADPSVTANLVIQVQELQDEVRLLRGIIEEQEREIATLKQRQRDQYLDLDQRITAQQRSPGSEAGGPGAAVSLDGPGSQPDADVRGQADATEGAETRTAATTAGTPAVDVPEVRAPMDTPSDTTGLGVPQAQSQQAPANPADEKAAYDQAFQALKELRYADAAEQFQAFTARYPESEYADNAQYWLGESYYVTRNYDIALEAFEQLLQRYPQSSKVADALLKVGYTHYELKQWDQARAALEQVQQQYPDTTLARLAENRLRSMRMEGHLQ